MITNILVLTDFSLAAKNALEYTIQLAQKISAGVRVMHVDMLPVMEVPYPAANYAELILSREKSIHKNLDALKQSMSRKYSVNLETISHIGSLYESMDSYCKENNIDMVVMGTTGGSALEQVLIGSNTTAVVRRIKIPVLIIPEECKYRAIKKITYASDYTENDFPDIARLFYLAEQYKAELTVLHVKSEIDNFLKKSSNFFTRNRKDISFKNWKSKRITDPDIMTGINQYVSKNKTDLLILAKHNRSFFEKIFHRSLSKRMAFHTKIPLLILNM
jgi:nucleotide-binding universal stress UspA family protein